MKKLVIVAGVLAAVMSTALAQGYGAESRHGSVQAYGAKVVLVNAPGGAYIQCNGGPNSPVRCVPDGW